MPLLQDPGRRLPQELNAVASKSQLQARGATNGAWEPSEGSGEFFMPFLARYNGVLVLGGTGGAIYPRRVPRGMPAGTLPNQKRAKEAEL